MKQEDINRLKEICEKEGFEVRTRVINKDVFEITKKGPWDKVNFVKVIDTTGMLNVTLNKIYKVIDYRFGEIRFYDDKNKLEARNVIHGNFAGATDQEYRTQDPWEGVEFIRLGINGAIFRVKKVLESKVLVHGGIDGAFISKKDGTTSTEKAYFEQIKKEAFERFGEICNGDQFDCSIWGGSRRAEYTRNANKWRYEKKHDILTLDHFCLYNSGKWATKLPKKAKVDFITSSGMSNNGENGKFIGGDYKFTFKIENVEHKNLHHIGDFLSKQLENYLNDNQE